ARRVPRREVIPRRRTEENHDRRTSDGIRVSRGDQAIAQKRDRPHPAADDVVLHQLDDTHVIRVERIGAGCQVDRDTPDEVPPLGRVLGTIDPSEELPGCHERAGRHVPSAHLLSSTTSLAAVVRSGAARKVGRSAAAFWRISRASSALVPSSRTTTGTLNPSSLPAFTSALAMMSHLAMPPNTFTRMPLIFLSASRMRNASRARASSTLPPTSRKFAGFPPWYLMMSIVPIASPAPFTRQPMVPSSWM